MLLARRDPRPLTDVLLASLWPTRGFRRSARYVWLRLMRLASSPEALARGVAAGLFAASLPILGAQIIVAVMLAFFVRGRIAAAVLATFWANPVTLPVMWGASYGLGTLLLGVDGGQISGDLERLMQLDSAFGLPPAERTAAVYAAVGPVARPLVIGAVPLAASIAACGYFLTLALTRRRGRKV
ncbi:MAG: DUF2062 domain-containing protein [Hyphomicrobiaceae bacterium]|nr:DUF2062 domain-containing protein [Hyphomicrobiaceae bacterium]